MKAIADFGINALNTGMVSCISTYHRIPIGFLAQLEFLIR
jgi:hypothetical protein